MVTEMLATVTRRWATLEAVRESYVLSSRLAIAAG